MLRFNSGETPEYGTARFTYYPSMIVGWYPNMLMVLALHPLGPTKAYNIVESYYPKKIVLFKHEFVKAKRATYIETYIEDDEIAERTDAGRLTLLKHGTNEVGPYQSPMENGMQHFREWYQRTMHC